MQAVVFKSVPVSRIALMPASTCISAEPRCCCATPLAGIVDDIFGANFVSGTTSGDPYDDNGHGTFVAGVVGAVGNNKIGISGVSQVASIVGEQRWRFTDPTAWTPTVHEW